MKYLITGASGQLGRAVNDYARFRGYESLAFDSSQLDICNADQVISVIDEVRPDYVINCAAFTDITKAKDDPKLCYAVNADGVRTLALACQRYDIELIHLSSDHVFSGNKNGQYHENDEADPIGEYGRSKLLGEQYLRSVWHKHIILRSSWVFGEYGDNFFTRILAAANNSGAELKVHADQHGCPTYSHDLAAVVVAITEQLNCRTTDQLWGTYHYCGYDTTTWHKLALYILQENGRFTNTTPPAITPIATEDHQPNWLQRPNSVLNCQKILNIFGIKQRPWKNGVIKSLKAFYVDRVAS